YTRTDEGKAYPVHYRRKGRMAAREETIQNVNQLAAGKKVFYFQQPVVSPDNRLAAFRTNSRGDRKFTITIKDLSTGKMLPDSLPDKAAGSFAWTNDSRQFFYVEYDKTIRPYKVMLHTLGTPETADREVFAEKDSTFYVSIYTSTDRKYLFIQSGSFTSSEVYYLPLS
ncbi:MAG: oligopeptidase B, partial [Chitinophagaceae bacterium]